MWFLLEILAATVVFSAIGAALAVGLLSPALLHGLAALGVVTSPQAAGDPFYPERAQRMEQEGEATVECQVVDEKRLEACEVISENPPGWGFGEAAVHRVTAPNAGIDPALLKGRTSYRTRVAFRLQD